MFYLLYAVQLCKVHRKWNAFSANIFNLIVHGKLDQMNKEAKAFQSLWQQFWEDWSDPENIFYRNDTDSKCIKNVIVSLKLCSFLLFISTINHKAAPTAVKNLHLIQVKNIYFATPFYCYGGTRVPLLK